MTRKSITIVVLALILVLAATVGCKNEPEHQHTFSET